MGKKKKRKEKMLIQIDVYGVLFFSLIFLILLFQLPNFKQFNGNNFMHTLTQHR